MPIKKKAHRIYLLFCAGLILYGIILGLTWGDSIYFSFLKTFTFQSNLLLVVGFLVMLMLNENKARHYVSVSVILATTGTGLIYNFLLVPFAQAPMFFSEELRSGYVNFSTHILAMILAPANYFIFEQKGILTYSHIFIGIIFPAVYWLVFVTIGERIDFFPYFFMDHTYAGRGVVFLWFGLLLTFFGGLGFLLILYDRSRKKHASRI